ncbi:hypothetical protein [Actinoplanes utahensis]|uniref:hypothetical protein n=1 Tax=Actinoplanes utahensis TaxID=1869 RepID=UPI0006923546|nr:hypothetical protein [Actinoplanes utahensis]GIF29745.1 hypothetical protein Aut01nite_27310 [Actinoplanes utahensis]
MLGRIRERTTTPRLYWLVATGLVLLGLATGAAAVAEVQNRSALITDVAEVSGPISVDAQTLYRSLADADTTAATAFLSSGGESAELRMRYLNHIARATASLSVALRDADDANAARLRVVADQLPIYTGLVETARSNHRLGVPLGGAYLREASELMQQRILPEAAGVFNSTTRHLIAEQVEAAGFPRLLLLLVVLTVAALVAAQVMLARRSRRVFNVGLIAATLAVVLATSWSLVAFVATAKRLETGLRDGSALVALVADTGRAALQARTNEALTLVARGGGAAFEEKFAGYMTELVGEDGTSGLFEAAIAQAPVADRATLVAAQREAQSWRKLHAEIRQADDGGDWDTAVEMATATGDDAVPAVFERLDAGLSKVLDAGNQRVDAQAERAASALRGLTAGWVLLTAGLVAAVVLGFRPRIGEYR